MPAKSYSITEPQFFLQVVFKMQARKTTPQRPWTLGGNAGTAGNSVAPRQQLSLFLKHVSPFHLLHTAPSVILS